MLLKEKPDYSERAAAGGFAAAREDDLEPRSTADAFKRRRRCTRRSWATSCTSACSPSSSCSCRTSCSSRGFLGFDWPGLPNNAIYVLGVATLASGIALLVRRVTSPVLKLISNFDDYFSWFVTMVPLIDRAADPDPLRHPLRDAARDPHPERRAADDLAAVRQARTHVPRLHHPRHDRNGL